MSGTTRLLPKNAKEQKHFFTTPLLVLEQFLVLSAAGVASGLTGIGMIVAAPLGIIATVFGFSLAALTGVCKKLEPKIYKHRDIVSLTIAKRDSVNQLVSKALTDQKIEDSE